MCYRCKLFIIEYIKLLTNADGSFVCQLNSERKESGVKEQFVQHGAGEYYGLKVLSTLCYKHASLILPFFMSSLSNSPPSQNFMPHKLLYHMLPHVYIISISNNPPL